MLITKLLRTMPRTTPAPLEVVSSGLSCDIDRFSEDIDSRQLLELKMFIQLFKTESSTHYFTFISAPQAGRREGHGILSETFRSSEKGEESLGHLIGWDGEFDFWIFYKLRIEIAEP